MALRPIRSTFSILKLAALRRARGVQAEARIRLAQAGQDIPEPIRALVQHDANKLALILAPEEKGAKDDADRYFAQARGIAAQLAGTNREVYETTAKAVEALGQALGLLRAASGILASFLDSRMVGFIKSEVEVEDWILSRTEGILGLLDDGRQNEAHIQAADLAAKAESALAGARENERIAAALLRDKEGMAKTAELLTQLEEDAGREAAEDLARRLEGLI